MEDEKEKLLDKITSVATARLKIPIISTYIAVLIIYNWDIIYFLVYQKDTAINKIQYIKTHYHQLYYSRILECLLIAVAILVVFTILNTILNFLLKWFYKKDKEVKEEIDSHEKIKQLTEQLAIAFNELKKTKDENKNLSNVNDGLSKNPLNKFNFETSEIARKELSVIINLLSQNEYGDKQIYSLKEFLAIIKKEPKISPALLLQRATYQDEMQDVINFLESKNLIQKIAANNYDNKPAYFKLNKSFIEILNLE